MTEARPGFGAGEYARRWEALQARMAAAKQDALYAATDHALTELRPGMTAQGAHRLLTDSLRTHGATPCGGRLGHGLGVTLTEWPSCTNRDTTVLRENMVLTLEPGVEIAPGKIMVHEENIVLRADGPELLSPRAPCDLPEIEI
ncbi:M24 family metallopeptidase [Antarctobacter heliothermus]|uniref:Metallopeptidase family M24 n=1 Tax=Antarctobacter heliothermus TaxID=74033 RepID=A0A239JNP9_9RHOB|nr:Metallopeptidase family M24 [Antarctobacter heliothermus]